MGHALGDIAAISAKDLDGDGCDEVVFGFAGEDTLFVYTTCDAAGNLAFAEYKPAGAQAPVVVTLDSGAKIRSFNASIVLADADGDTSQGGGRDIVVNANDCNVHIAYGDGHGHFSSKPIALSGGVFDHKTSAFDFPAPDLYQMAVDPNSILVAGRFDTVGPNEADQIAPVQCPPSSSTFTSDACEPIAGGCEGLVLDIDDDGHDDFIATQGQQIGLVVNRARDDGPGFHMTLVETECPPHHLVAGDFDADGVADFAFLDQTAIVNGPPATVLKVVYGNSHAAPEPPIAGGGLANRGMGLASGHFLNLQTITDHDEVVPKEHDAPKGHRLFAALSFGDGNDAPSGIAAITVSEERDTTAPLYVHDVVTTGAAPIPDLELLATTKGRFVSTPIGPMVGLAAVARESGKPPGLWLISRDVHYGNARATLSKIDGLECNSCVLAALPRKAGEPEALLYFEGNTLITYTAGPDGFKELRRMSTEHAFESVDHGNPPKYAQRPLVADLDEKKGPKYEAGDPDVVLRATNGDLVVFWGDGKGGFEEDTLVGVPDCKDPCPARLLQAVAKIQLALDASDADVLKERIVVVGPGLIDFYRIVDRKAVPLDRPKGLVPPKLDTDYVSVGVADIDGDGVDDLAIMPSSTSIKVLRGIPEHE